MRILDPTIFVAWKFKIPGLALANCSGDGTTPTPSIIMSYIFAISPSAVSGLTVFMIAMVFLLVIGKLLKELYLFAFAGIPCSGPDQTEDFAKKAELWGASLGETKTAQAINRSYFL